MKTVEEYVEALLRVDLFHIGAQTNYTRISVEGIEKEIPAKLTMTFKWSAKDIGFGRLFLRIQDNKVICDSETMSANFVEAVFVKWARSMRLNSRDADADEIPVSSD